MTALADECCSILLAFRCARRVRIDGRVVLCTGAVELIPADAEPGDLVAVVAKYETSFGMLLDGR